MTTIAVTTANGNSDVTLIGLDVTCLGHPENTFRLLGNGIYQGLEWWIVEGEWDADFADCADFLISFVEG